MHAPVIAGRLVMMAGGRFFTGCGGMTMPVHGGGRGSCFPAFRQAAEQHRSRCESLRRERNEQSAEDRDLESPDHVS
jgi:hypothetical protein